MKVLIVPTWYPSGEDKLMGIYHKEFTVALNRFGVDADMLFIDRQRLSKPIKYLLMKKKVVENEENYKVYKYRMLNLRPISFDLQMDSYVHKFDKAFKDYIKNNGKPDVIHAMVSIPAGYAACKIGKKYNIPVVITEHSSDFQKFYTEKEWNKYSSFVLANATMSTVSNYMKDFVLKYTDKCYVIPNQLNTEMFKNDRKKHIPKDVFNLISVCALRQGKRIDIAFKAIRKLIDSGMNIHYNIIGDGFYENIFKECMVKENLEEYVTFLGRKDKKEIPKFLEEADALLISSEVESFAIPGIEALASGIPVITTACLGPIEFVDEKTGAIAKINDPDDLARAIKEVYDNYSKYDKNYMNQVAERFSEKNVATKAKEVYESVIKEYK